MQPPAAMNREVQIDVQGMMVSAGPTTVLNRNSPRFSTQRANQRAGFPVVEKGNHLNNAVVDKQYCSALTTTTQRKGKFHYIVA